MRERRTFHGCTPHPQKVNDLEVIMTGTNVASIKERRVVGNGGKLPCFVYLVSFSSRGLPVCAGAKCTHEFIKCILVIELYTTEYQNVVTC